MSPPSFLLLFYFASFPKVMAIFTIEYSHPLFFFLVILFHSSKYLDVANIINLCPLYKKTDRFLR